MALIDLILLFNKAYDVASPYGDGCERGLTLGDLAKLLDSMPEIEPERKKGKWEITEAYPHNVYCSECHKRYAQTHWEVWEDGSLPRKYCPNCGADMRGEQDDR